MWEGIEDLAVHVGCRVGQFWGLNVVSGDTSATCRWADSDIAPFWAPTMSCRFRQLPTFSLYIRRNYY